MLIAIWFAITVAVFPAISMGRGGLSPVQRGDFNFWPDTGGLIL